MSADNLVNMPQNGEQITFENGDCNNFPASVTLRVCGYLPGMWGRVILIGEEIGNHGCPVGDVLQLVVPMATLEARRVHRRER